MFVDNSCHVSRIDVCFVFVDNSCHVSRIDVCFVFVDNSCHVSRIDVCFVFVDNSCHVFSTDVCFVFVDNSCHVSRTDVCFVFVDNSLLWSVCYYFDTLSSVLCPILVSYKNCSLQWRNRDKILKQNFDIVSVISQFWFLKCISVT